LRLCPGADRRLHTGAAAGAGALSADCPVAGGTAAAYPLPGSPIGPAPRGGLCSVVGLAGGAALSRSPAVAQQIHRSIDPDPVPAAALLVAVDADLASLAGAGGIH